MNYCWKNTTADSGQGNQDWGGVGRTLTSIFYPRILLLIIFTVCLYFLVDEKKKNVRKLRWLPENVPSGVEDSFLRLDGGASRLMALGWCSGDRTMADMAICCLAVAGVDGCGWSVAFR